MRLNKFALTLTAAALLPTFACAGTDEVAASFERDLHRGASIESPMVAQAEADPLDIINSILNREPDAVVASFDRDLYRVPTVAPMVVANEADPLAIAINAVLWSEMVKPTIHVALVNGYSR